MGCQHIARVVGLALERPARHGLRRRRPDIAGGQGARGAIAHTEPEQVEALAAQEAVGVVEGVLVRLLGADEVDLELDGDDAQRIEASLEGLQDLEVSAVDVDLEVVEIGPAALRQQVGNDNGLAGIGKAA